MSRGFRCARLAQGVGARKSIVLHAGLDDSAHGRERRKVVLKKIRSGGLACQADVGDGDCIALAVTAGFAAACKISFQRPQGLADPVPNPFEARGFIELELVLEVFAHARYQERMGIAGYDLSKPPYPCSRAWRRRQERRMRVGLLEIFH